MPQDAFHIRRLAKELNALLSGCRINKINQADKDELTFIIYTGFKAVKLILSTNASFARICLSDTEKEPAAVAPNFCMLLRKHLTGAEILSVAQHENERILKIELFCRSDFSSAKRVLYAELMGKYSNLILTENGVILGALKSTSLEAGAHRILFSGAKYAYPEPQDKLSPFFAEGIAAREQEFFALKERTEENEAEFIFSSVSGIALSTAREMAKRRGDTPLPQFIGRFFNEEPCEPCIVYKNGVPYDFFAFSVDSGKKTPSLMKAEDEYYTFKENARLFSEKKIRLVSAAKALKKKREKTLAITMDRLKDAENAEENKIKGELITANLYKIKKGDKLLVAENWYSAQNEEVEIPLDENLAPAQNAQKYFKAYAKAKRTKEALLPRMKKEQEEKDYADSILSALERAETDTDVKEIEEELVLLGLIRPSVKKADGKKQNAAAPFREYEYGGFTIRSGRNNLQNDRLLKASDGEDLWLHAQKYHSSFVVVKTEGKEVPEEVLSFAAELCAYHSDGKNGDKIPVDYCPRKKVKKPSGAKAGFVVYNEYKTVLVSPKDHKDYLK